MRYVQPKCPTEGCGRLVKGEVDLVPGTAEVVWNDDGTECEYLGETEMHWDGQENELRLEQRIKSTDLPVLQHGGMMVRVTCGEHEWETEQYDG